MESTAMPAGRLPTRPSRLSLLALVTLAIAIAGVGAFLAIGLFQAGAPAQEAPVQEGTYDVTEGIPRASARSRSRPSTSSAARRPRTSPVRPTPRAHAAGQDPGPGRLQLTNLLEQPVEYTPAQLTLLSVDKGEATS